jgi:hypothetical protein
MKKWQRLYTENSSLGNKCLYTEHWFARLAEKGKGTIDGYITMFNCNAILRLDGDCFVNPSHS